LRAHGLVGNALNEALVTFNVGKQLGNRLIHPLLEYEKTLAPR
jgi:hypothetical protein